MSTKIGIGFSPALSPETAAKEAAFESKIQLNSDRIDIAIIFSTIQYDPQITVPILRTVLNQAKMIGCSTAGIILSNSIETRGIAVLTMSSDEFKFSTDYVDGLNQQNMEKAGGLLAHNMLEGFNREKRNAFLYFVDGHLGNGSAFLKGAHEVFGNAFSIVGAGSSDDFHFANSFQIFDDTILRHGASSLMIGGHSALGIGCRHGWKPLGKPRIVDHAERNIIKSIAGKKATDLYLEYFGPHIEELRSTRFGQMSILYPLGIYVPNSPEYLLRAIVDFREDGSIVCQGDVPEGAEVHLMIGNKDSCKQAAMEAADEAKVGLLGRPPKLIIIFESMARLKLLGRSATMEIEHIKHILGTDIPMIGMYTHGEACPFQATGKFNNPYFLNGSMVVMAVS